MPRTAGVATVLAESGLVGRLAGIEGRCRVVDVAGDNVVAVAVDAVRETAVGLGLNCDIGMTVGWKVEVRGREGALEARRCSRGRVCLGASLDVAGLSPRMYSHTSPGRFDFLHLLHIGWAWSQATLRFRHGSHACGRPFFRSKSRGGVCVESIWGVDMNSFSSLRRSKAHNVPRITRLNVS